MLSLCLGNLIKRTAGAVSHRECRRRLRSEALDAFGEAVAEG